MTPGKQIISVVSDPVAMRPVGYVATEFINMYRSRLKVNRRINRQGIRSHPLSTEYILIINVMTIRISFILAEDKYACLHIALLDNPYY